MKSYFRILLPLSTAVMTFLQARAQQPGWLSLATGEAGLSGKSVFCISVADINNDHYPDLVVISGGWSTTAENGIRVYINVPDTSSGQGNRRMFADVTSVSGVNRKPGSAEPSRGTIAVALADINNDGNIDMVRGSYYHRLGTFTDRGDRCEVLLGDGTGRFTLVAGNGLHELGLVNVIGFSFLDYDKDGNIDLFIAPWSRDHDNDIWDLGYLMKGNGDGTFTHVSAQAGITIPEPMYGSSAVDWNNDGWPDIVTSPYCRTNGQLWKNNGNGTFTNVAAQAGYNARYMPGDGGQTLCMWSNAPEDYDNDGDMDFFFTLVHGGAGANEGRSAIALNGGAANGYRLTTDRGITERKPPQSDHLGDYDASWFDIDNDGLKDLVMTQGYYRPATDRLYVFRQKADHQLVDITPEIGMVIPETNDLHLLEVLDYDLDGDDDIIYCRDAAPQQIHLLRNEIGQDNSWTGVILRAPQGVNRSCIGARIYVWSGGVQHMREVYAGRGNASGQQPFAMLFGLGSQAAIDSITVVWPDAGGGRTTVHHPPVNRYLEITANGLAVEKLQGREETGLKVYPNPAKDFILMQLGNNEPVARVEVYDILGRQMAGSATCEKPEITCYYTVAHLPAGRYFLKVYTARGNVYTGSFVR